MRAAIITAVVAAFAIAGCGSSATTSTQAPAAHVTTQPSTPVLLRHLQGEIKSHFASQYKQAVGESITVRKVECFKQTTTTARCIAFVTGPDGSDGTVPVESTFDPQTGAGMWSVGQ